MKRYQIFISSTYSDLKSERKEIFQSLISANYIISGMEFFPAAGIKQFEYIKKIIDDCDYYVLIISGRYGTLNSSKGISFTEQEYDYAIQKGLPILVFIKENFMDLCTMSGGKDSDKLVNFVDKVQKNILCKYWNTSSELISSVLVSIGEAMTLCPAIGWNRGVSNESNLLGKIDTLVKENDNLKQELEKVKKLKSFEQIKLELLASENDKFVISGEYRYSRDHYQHSNPVKITKTWDEIFDAIGPYLYASLNYSSFCYNLLMALKSKDQNLECSSINEDSIQTIKVQLSALGLISIFDSKATSGGVIEFIRLTDFGKTYLTNLKTIKKDPLKKND